MIKNAINGFKFQYRNLLLLKAILRWFLNKNLSKLMFHSFVFFGNKLYLSYQTTLYIVMKFIFAFNLLILR